MHENGKINLNFLKKKRIKIYFLLNQMIKYLFLCKLLLKPLCLFKSASIRGRIRPLWSPLLVQKSTNVTQIKIHVTTVEMDGTIGQIVYMLQNYKYILQK